MFVESTIGRKAKRYFTQVLLIWAVMMLVGAISCLFTARWALNPKNILETAPFMFLFAAFMRGLDLVTKGSFPFSEFREIGLWPMPPDLDDPAPRDLWQEAMDAHMERVRKEQEAQSAERVRVDEARRWRVHQSRMARAAARQGLRQQWRRQNRQRFGPTGNELRPIRTRFANLERLRMWHDA